MNRKQRIALIAGALLWLYVGLLFVPHYQSATFEAASSDLDSPISVSVDQGWTTRPLISRKQVPTEREPYTEGGTTYSYSGVVSYRILWLPYVGMLAAGAALVGLVPVFLRSKPEAADPEPADPESPDAGG